ncbi:MAG: hypothetical protein CL625_06800 [Arenimonas sp.]|nr:hypothetical protein [Arenimonas sp.]
MGTAAFAAIAHAALVAVAARAIGVELIYIAAISFVVAWVVAVIGGAVLLSVTQVFGLGLAASLAVFLVAIQALTIGLEMYVFESGLDAVSWRYSLISVPSALLAWYLSVYACHKK